MQACSFSRKPKVQWKRNPTHESASLSYRDIPSVIINVSSALFRITECSTSISSRLATIFFSSHSRYLRIISMRSARVSRKVDSRTLISSTLRIPCYWRSRENFHHNISYNIRIRGINLCSIHRIIWTMITRHLIQRVRTHHAHLEELKVH